MNDKMRVLHGRLASILATLRHGEMIFIADAGSGTHAKSLVPLSPDVEVIDLAVVTGVPSLADILPTIIDTGDIEAAIVTDGMAGANPAGRKLIEDLLGAENVHEMNYIPDFYHLRNRAKVFIQTGDYAVHSQVVLIAGYPSPPIPLDWLTSSEWFDSAPLGGTAPTDGGEVPQC